MFAPHAILAAGSASAGPWQAAALGVVQGLTEFLPVSSSGHLVLLEHLLGVRRPGLALETGLHLGTLAAVIWEYRRDLADALAALGGRQGSADGGRILLWLAVATLPAGAAGLALGGLVERLFGSLTATAVAWCLGGLVLLAAGRLPAGRRTLVAMRWRDALWIGAAQALALVPGISRAGATVAAGLARGLTPSEATRFAFLLSLPAVGGAVLLHAGGLAGAGWGIWLGAAVAGGVGLLAVRAAAARVRAGGLGLFGTYCVALGSLLLLRGALIGEWR